MAIRTFFNSRKGKILLAVVVFLVILRIALPYIILHYANQRLASMDGYFGHVNDIEVALFRGAYVLDSFYLNEVDAKSHRQTAFISAQSVDLSLEWKALFSGSLVGELVFEEPSLRFTQNQVDLDEVSKDTADFRDLLHDFMPMKVNQCEMRNGKLEYIDNSTTPKLYLIVNKINGFAHNLRNVYSPNDLLPSDIQATGSVYEGDLTFNMKLNPLAERPLFDLNTSVERTNLVGLNDFFKAYGRFDVSKGQFNMFMEAAAKDGQFVGYVKPLIHDLDVVDWKGQDKNDNFFRKIWESLVGGTFKVLKNQRTDQIATKIKFSGDIDNPKANLFQAVVIVLQNAFVKALQPAIENQISLNNVKEAALKKNKSLLGRLLGKGKKKKK